MCQPPVLRVFERAMEDQISQDRLFLLPPGLPIMPDITIPLLPLTTDALHHVVPPSTLAIHTNSRHDLSNLLCHSCESLIRPQVVDTHQVPGNLEVVSHDGAVLLPPS